MDRVTREKRSEIMSRVGKKDTGPEKAVRSVLHKMGFRFRKNRRDLPGSPDIVLPKYKTVIFVHGCFWHRHPGCSKSGVPKSNQDFWERKFERNIDRDRNNAVELERAGWHVNVIWECQLKDLSLLEEYLTSILSYERTGVAPSKENRK